MKCLQNIRLPMMFLELPGSLCKCLDNRRRFCTQVKRSFVSSSLEAIVCWNTMVNRVVKVILVICFITVVTAHGPPRERDNEDIAMGRKMGPKWCSMAKVCNHDRIPVCGISHAGDIMGFRDLCDMFDYNCIRRRNYKQTACPEDKSVLTVSRRPTSSFYDD